MKSFTYTAKQPLLICLFSALLSCDDFVGVSPPRTALVKSTVFSDRETANAAILDIYYQFRSAGFASGTIFSVTFLSSLSADEQLLYYSANPATRIQIQQFSENAILPNNTQVLSLWTDLYSCIYKTNAVLDGLASSTKIPLADARWLEGEARLLRALCYFYLVNLYGDAPLALSTDYRLNAKQARAPEADVYHQIISDLVLSRDLLGEENPFANGESVRANTFVASALLARVYLYTGDWQNAELTSSTVIDNPRYHLETELSDVFLRSSGEAILQLWSDLFPNDLNLYRVLGSGPRNCALRPEFVSGFEASDKRATAWIGSATAGGILHHFARKYNSTSIPPLQYSTVLRLAEQYLIRAEARAQLGNIEGAQSDLNVIRTRAGLPDTPANDKTGLLAAVAQERRSEMFTEWGHRWFDLKRTGQADAVLSPLKPAWQSTDILLPIPESEINNNASLTGAQNLGY